MLRHPVASLAIATIVALLPMLLLGASMKSHDGHDHAMWIEMFSRQFFRGDLYPRWLVEANAGMGSPTFHYYFPLPYYLSLPLAWMSPFDPDGRYRLAVMSALTLFMSGITMRAWLLQLFGRKAALLGGLIYLLLPFHVLFDIVIRHAYPQAVATTLLPLMLYAIHRLVDDRPYGFTLLVGTISALLLTHLPTALIAAPFVGLYALMITLYSGHGRSLWKILFALPIAAALSSFYTAPMALMRPFVSMESTVVGYLRYENHFLIGGKLWDQSFNGMIEILVVLAVLLSIFLAFNTGKVVDKSEEQVDRTIPWKIFSLFTIAASSFMMWEGSAVVWEHVSIIRMVQFPHRFLVMFTIGFTMLCAGALHHGRLTRIDHEEDDPMKVSDDVEHRSPRGARWIYAIVIVMMLGSLALFVKYDYIFYVAPKSDFRDPGIAEELRLRVQPIEYVTRWARRTVPSDENGFFRYVTASTGWERGYRRVAGAGSVRIVDDDVETITIRAESTRGMTIDLHRFYFIDQSIAVDSGLAALRPSPIDGMMRVTIPAGKREVTIRRVMTPPEIRGMILSIVALLLLILFERVESVRRMRMRSSDFAA